MRLHTVFHGTIPKSSRSDDPNEDVVCPEGLPEYIQRVALSDGASESYDSLTLAQILCANWLESTPPRLRLKKVLKEFERRSELEGLGWAKAAAYARGSFATFLGVDLQKGNLTVLAIGDTMMFLHNPNSDLCTGMPYESLDQVPSRPLLVSSVRSQNTFYRPGQIKNFCRKFTVTPGTTILMMTDALGLWFLSQKTPDANTILKRLQNQVDFESFVLETRAANKIKDDDTTLIHLEVANE